MKPISATEIDKIIKKSKFLRKELIASALPASNHSIYMARTKHSKDIVFFIDEYNDNERMSSIEGFVLKTDDKGRTKEHKVCELTYYLGRDFYRTGHCAMLLNIELTDNEFAGEGVGLYTLKALEYGAATRGFYRAEGRLRATEEVYQNFYVRNGYADYRDDDYSLMVAKSLRDDDLTMTHNNILNHKTIKVFKDINAFKDFAPKSTSGGTSGAQAHNH